MGVITHPEKIMGITRYILSFLFTAIPGVAVAVDGASRVDVQQSARDTGISAIWVLANISYAGMRAQNNPSAGWRVVSFIFGFPGTLLTY